MKTYSSFLNNLHEWDHIIVRKKLVFSMYQTNSFKDRYCLFLNPAKLCVFHNHKYFKDHCPVSL